MLLPVPASQAPVTPPTTRGARKGTVALLLLATALGTGCTEGMSSPEGAASGTAAARASDTPDPTRGLAAIAGGALVIDVRTPEEYARGHLESAHLLPVDDLSAKLALVEEWAAGDKGKPVVVYCASGRRATRAARMLRDAGFENVINGGGWSDLQSAPH